MRQCLRNSELHKRFEVAISSGCGYSSIIGQLIDVLKTEVGYDTAEVEVSEYFSRYSLEAVGRTTLGYSFGPLKKHGTDYSRALKEFG